MIDTEQDKFRERLSRLGLTQTRAASLMGIDPVIIRRWLRPKNHLDIAGYAWRFLWLFGRYPEIMEDLKDNYKESGG